MVGFSEQGVVFHLKKMFEFYMKTGKVAEILETAEI